MSALQTRSARAKSMRLAGTALLTSSLLLATTGCYTTSNVVTMAPLKTDFPVSASGQYVDGSGAIVEEDDYESVAPFTIERTYEVPRHSEGQTTLELEPELQRIVQQAGGDAITDLKIEAVEYDSGSHGSAAGWKIFGWSMSITGGLILGTGAALGGDAGDILYPIGGVTLGIGVASFLLSLTTNDPPKWQMQVTGQVVRRKGGEAAPAAEEAEPKDL
jgi:hypothetical protein